MSALDRFSRDGSLLLGGGRAILLQVADPVVGVAVADHSDFSRQPVRRLHNTLTFVYGVMLGTPEQAAAVARLTARAHAAIPGGDDPHRQLWVAATLYDTAVRVYERLHGPLDPTDAELVLAAYATLGTSLEVPLELWPASRAEFDAYWVDAVARLEVGPAGRRVAHDLFHPASAPLWLRAALPLAELLTASLLPPTLRAAYGLRWSPCRRRRARLAWGVVRLAARVLPDRLLAAPSRYYLRRLRGLMDSPPRCAS